MSEQEKRVVEKLAQMPAPLRERFVAMAEGAALALDELKGETDGRDDKGNS